MSRTVVMLAILAANGPPVAFADPPAAGAPAETQQSNGASQAAAATPAATAATAPQVATTTPARSASDEPQGEKQLRDQGYKPAMRNGERVFCKREIPMGSHLPTALHCLTVQEAALIAQEGRETTERIQRTTPGCPGGAAGGCGH
jgi:hypothetical protein